MRYVSSCWMGIVAFAIWGCGDESVRAPGSTQDTPVWGGDTTDATATPDVVPARDIASAGDTEPATPDALADVAPSAPDADAAAWDTVSDVVAPDAADTSDGYDLPEDTGPAPFDTAVDAGPPPEDATSDAGPAPDEGTWDNPILIVAFPFVHTGDTAAAPANEADFYSPCAPSIDESGGEVVFSLTLEMAGLLTATIDDLPGDGVDVDVHVLTAPEPGACVARDNLSVTAKLEPGEHFVAVDTYRNASGKALAGSFTLVVAFEPGATEAACLVPLAECVSGDAPTPNGVPTEAPGTGGCPAGMVRIDAFCIDRYEDMLVEVLPNGGLAPFSPYQNPGPTKVRAMSVSGAVPQGYIDQVRAASACGDAGKRLCTDTEWLRACQGPGALTYPYGPLRWPKFCNDSRHCHPAVQTFGTTASWIWSSLGDSCIDQQPYGLAEAGRYEACVTEEGVFDMMGNLHEWTADPEGTFRGGFYADTQINGAGCLYKTTAHNVYHWDYSTGFRCCADP